MLHRASLVLATSAMLAAGAAAKPGSGLQGDLNIRLGETAAMIINGQPVRFHIAPEAVAVATLNGDAARRIGLKPSMIGYLYVIGPVRIGFRTDNARYGAGDAAFRSRTSFSDRQVTDRADGIAGPATFPFRRTILTLREPGPADRAISFPLNKDMGRSQTSVKIDIDGRPVYAAFSLDRRESLVTASGGQWIADAHGGRFDGEAREAPILYRVSRPIRPLRLQRPLKLGALEIRNLAVRVSDTGNVQGIADGTEPDPNEIVVTADGKRKIPNQRLYIGMDTIGHCASITYDFAAGTVTLMCPAQPGATRAN